MRKLITVQGQIQWKATQVSSDRWLGVCDAMNLSMEGDTLDELYSLIDESIALVLTELLSENQLETYLSERGWHATIPDIDDEENVEFDVPWQLIAEGAKSDQKRAYC